MSADPTRLRDDPSSPDGLRDLMRHAAPPPRIDAATKAASAAAVTSLGASAAAAATSGATFAGVKLWLVVGGLTVVAVGTTVGALTVGGGGDPAPVAEAAAAPEEEPGGASHAATPVAQAPAPSEPIVEEVEAPVAPAADEPPSGRAPSRGARAVTDDDEPAAPSARGLADEADLLEDARRLLTTDPAGALARTERHARRHRHGLLAAEREMIAIDALRRLGRRAQAQRRARRLVESAPSGMYAERARALIADLSEEGAAAQGR